MPSIAFRRRVAHLAAVALIAGTAFAAGLAVAAQPHMEAALNALQTAAAELKNAEHNKGGHRAKALGLVEDALKEVRLGIAAGA